MIDRGRGCWWRVYPLATSFRYKRAPLPPNTHNSLTHTGSNMSRYEEIEAILLEQIRREQAFLDAAIVRRGYCLAIVRAIDPTRLDRLSHWLGAVDIAVDEITPSEAVIKYLREGLWSLYRANQLAPF